MRLTRCVFGWLACRQAGRHVSRQLVGQLQYGPSTAQTLPMNPLVNPCHRVLVIPFHGVEMQLIMEKMHLALTTGPACPLPFFVSTSLVLYTPATRQVRSGMSHAVTTCCAGLQDEELIHQEEATDEYDE